MSGPLLWHLPISHYSEKVRWAFDWKRVPHRRRVMPPGLHPLGGLLLTGGRGYTVPVLGLEDGSRIGDSTAIIGWLEEHSGERPLYPSDAGDRARALELEDWFDENVGPPMRQWGFGALLTEPEAVEAFAVKQTEWAPVRVPTAAFAPVAKAFLSVRYSVGDAVMGEARRQVLQGLDRLEAELGRGSGEFLVGDKFSVADLTAASLFYPLVLPPNAPWQPVRTAAFEEVQSTVRDRPGFEWVQRMFKCYR
jgi:glutathione S-transferase